MFTALGILLLIFIIVVACIIRLWWVLAALMIVFIVHQASMKEERAECKAQGDELNWVGECVRIRVDVLPVRRK